MPYKKKSPSKVKNKKSPKKKSPKKKVAKPKNTKNTKNTKPEIKNIQIPINNKNKMNFQNMNFKNNNKKNIKLNMKGGSSIDCTGDVTPKNICKEVEKIQKDYQDTIDKLNKKIVTLMQDNYILQEQMNAVLEILSEKQVINKGELKNINYIRKLIGSLQI